MCVVDELRTLSNPAKPRILQLLKILFDVDHYPQDSISEMYSEIIDLTPSFLFLRKFNKRPVVTLMQMLKINAKKCFPSKCFLTSFAEINFSSDSQMNPNKCISNKCGTLVLPLFILFNAFQSTRSLQYRINILYLSV